jgi:O-acetyl-ADP-ribose deacetylase (regulator of RNase III)
MIATLYVLMIGAAVFTMLIWAVMSGTARGIGRGVVRRCRPPRAETGHRVLESGGIRPYQVTGIGGRLDRYIGIVCGDLRRVHCAEVWVNSENTEMQMARFNEFSVSSIIRYEGAVHDETGRVIDDGIADELARKLMGHRPVLPGTVIITRPGELRRNGVRYVAHVAAVQGEPGSGFRQIREVGRCVASVLAEIDRIDDPLPVETVLFPLLGTGQGAGELVPTVRTLTGAVIDYFIATPDTHVTTVFFLAYTDGELAAFEHDFAADQRLRPVEADKVAVLRDRGGRHPPVDDQQMFAVSGRPDTTPIPGQRKLRMGFAVDVSSYGKRPALAQEAVQERLSQLIGRVLERCRVGWDEVDHQLAGDGGIIVLPSDIDPTAVLPELVRSTARCLAEDNRLHDDRIRLRMAVGVGIVGHGAAGFTGAMVIGISRMLDCDPLRQALLDHPDADVAVLLSDHVHTYVVRPGYPGLPAAEFRLVTVELKEFRESAWLWVSQSASQQRPR